MDEPDGLRKGSKFERFFENFMNQQEGFELIAKHCRSEKGEMDYFYRVEIGGHPLWNRYQYLFVECKNQKKKISSKQMNHFILLLEDKNFFPSCCGIYLSTSGFSSFAKRAVKDARKTFKQLIFLVRKTDCIKLVDMGIRAYLQENFDKILATA